MLTLLWLYMRPVRHSPAWARHFAWRWMGLEDVWHKTRYSEWDRYFVWVFFVALIVWLAVSRRMGWWENEGSNPLTIASSIFSATTGTSLAAILTTEVVKVVSRPFMEYLDARKLEREMVRKGLREEGDKRTHRQWVEWNNARIQWEAVHSPDEPYPVPPPSLNGNQSS